MCWIHLEIRTEINLVALHTQSLILNFSIFIKQGHSKGTFKSGSREGKHSANKTIFSFMNN